MDMFTLNAANKNAERLVAGLASGVKSHEVDNENGAIKFNFNDGSSTTLQVQTPQAKVEKAVNAYLPKNEIFQGLIKSSPSWKNVKEYGVVGDGITDDTEAIQALFDNANAGDVIYFPTGYYLITKGLVINYKHIIIKGDNPCNWNFKHFNWSDRTKDTTFASCLKLADEVENDTLLTIKGASTNSDVVIDSMKFISSSGKFVNKSQNDTLNELGIEGEPYEYTVNKANVNGLCVDDSMKSSQLTLLYCTFSGFSGYGASLGNCGRTIGYCALECGIGLKTGIDSTLQFPYITMCRVGIKVKANCNILAYNLWIDLIKENAIECDDCLGGRVSGTIDHVGYACIRARYINGFVFDGGLSRWGGYYNSVSQENIKDMSKACAIYTDDYLGNCKINTTISTNKNWYDDNGSDRYSSPYLFCSKRVEDNTFMLNKDTPRFGFDNYNLSYNWSNNLFIVPRGMYMMVGGNLIDVKDTTLSPKKNICINGGKIDNYVKNQIPSMRYNLYSEKGGTTLRLYLSDDSWIKKLNFSSGTANGISYLVDNNGQIEVVGNPTDATKYSTVYLYGGAESNPETDIIIENDINIIFNKRDMNINIYIITNNGSITANEKIQTIASGTIIYGIKLLLSPIEYNNKFSFIISENIQEIEIPFIDSINYSPVSYTEESVLYNIGTKWYLDEIELSYGTGNKLNEVINNIFWKGNDYISFYHKQVTSIEMEYTVDDILKSDALKLLLAKIEALENASATTEN